MAAIDATMVSNILNATLPTGTTSAPAAFTGLGGTGMKLKLTSTASSGSASGTEITGTGYTSGGTAMTTSATASSAGSAVTLPGQASGISWTNGSGGAWSIVSIEITSSGGTRSWFGNFTGQPVAVAIGNTFNVAQNAISVSLS